MKTSRLTKATSTVSSVYKIIINNRTFIIFKRVRQNTWTVYENVNNVNLNNLDKMDWVDLPYKLTTKKKALEAINQCFS